MPSITYLKKSTAALTSLNLFTKWCTARDSVSTLIKRYLHHLPLAHKESALKYLCYYKPFDCLLNDPMGICTWVIVKLVHNKTASFLTFKQMKKIKVWNIQFFPKNIQPFVHEMSGNFLFTYIKQQWKCNHSKGTTVFLNGFFYLLENKNLRLPGLTGVGLFH